MTLLDIFQKLLKRVWVIIILVVIAVVGAYCVATSNKGDIYETSRLMNMSPDNEYGEIVPGSSTLSYVESMISNAIILWDTTIFADIVHEEMEKEYPAYSTQVTALDIKNATSYEKLKGVNFKVSVKYTDPQIASIIIEIISNEIQKYFNDCLPGLSNFMLVKPIDNATIPVVINAVSFKKTLFLYVFISIIVSVVVIIILELMFPKLLNSSRMEEVLGVKVLAVISNTNADGKRQKDLKENFEVKNEK